MSCDQRHISLHYCKVDALHGNALHARVVVYVVNVFVVRVLNVIDNNMTWTQNYIFTIIIIIIILYDTEAATVRFTASCQPSTLHLRRRRHRYIMYVYIGRSVRDIYALCRIHYVNYAPDPVNGRKCVCQNAVCYILLRRYNMYILIIQYISTYNVITYIIYIYYMCADRTAAWTILALLRDGRAVRRIWQWWWSEAYCSCHPDDRAQTRRQLDARSKVPGRISNRSGWPRTVNLWKLLQYVCGYITWPTMWKLFLQKRTLYTPIVILFIVWINKWSDVPINYDIM